MIVDHHIYRCGRLPAGAFTSALHSPRVCAVCTSQRIATLCSSSCPNIVDLEEEEAQNVSHPAGE